MISFSSEFVQPFFVLLVKFIVGRPDSRLQKVISRHETLMLRSVSNTLEQASFAAHRCTKIPASFFKLLAFSCSNFEKTISQNLLPCFSIRLLIQSLLVRSVLIHSIICRTQMYENFYELILSS